LLKGGCGTLAHDSEHRFKFIHDDVEVDFAIENTEHGLQAIHVCENFLYSKKKHFVQKQSY